MSGTLAPVPVLMAMAEMGRHLLGSGTRSARTPSPPSPLSPCEGRGGETDPEEGQTLPQAPGLPLRGGFPTDASPSPPAGVRGLGGEGIVPAPPIQRNGAAVPTMRSSSLPRRPGRAVAGALAVALAVAVAAAGIVAPPRPAAAQGATPVASPAAATLPEVLAPWLPEDLLGPGWDAAVEPVSSRDPRLAAVGIRSWTNGANRVVVFAFAPVADATQTWYVATDVFGGVASQLLLKSRAAWQPGSGAGPALPGCDRGRRAAYAADKGKDGVPIGLTLCAVHGGPVVLAVVTHAVDGQTGTAASDAVVGKIAGRG